MTSKVNSPHCLMELSTKEVKKLEYNMIILGGLAFKCKTKKGPMIATYEHIKLGKGVHLIDRVLHINGTKIYWSKINLCKMQNRVVVIVVI